MIKEYLLSEENQRILISVKRSSRKSIGLEVRATKIMKKTERNKDGFKEGYRRWEKFRGVGENHGKCCFL